MTNDRLRAALQQAGVQPDELAEIVQVDVRTVRRWLAGTTPYARQRAKVARALDTTEHNVWPDAVAAAPATPAAAQPADRIATYSSLSALDAPDWKQMMRDAIEHIDLLGTTLKQPLAVSGLPGLLAAKAQNGCQVRVLVSDPGPHLTPYIEQQGIGIHVLMMPPPRRSTASTVNSSSSSISVIRARATGLSCTSVGPVTEDSSTASPGTCRSAGTTALSRSTPRSTSTETTWTARNRRNRPTPTEWPAPNHPRPRAPQRRRHPPDAGQDGRTDPSPRRRRRLAIAKAKPRPALGEYGGYSCDSSPTK